jgi:predicted transposase YdaD
MFLVDLLRRINLPSLKLTSKSYVTEELKEFHNDLVFSFKIDKQPGYAFFILKHQSTPEPLMALRFIKYNTCLIEEYIKEKDDKAPWAIVATYASTTIPMKNLILILPPCMINLSIPQFLNS